MNKITDSLGNVLNKGDIVVTCDATNYISEKDKKLYINVITGEYKGKSIELDESLAKKYPIKKIEFKYSIEDIDDYQDKLSEQQTYELLHHCNEWNIAPIICAWYDDMDDLQDDYSEHCGYSKDTTNDYVNEYPQMFCEFSNGEIVKLSY